jgi:hypothetical protein
MQTRMFVWCPLFPPFYLCFISCDMLYERAGHTGHLYYFLLDAIILSPPSLNPHSSSLLGFRSLYPCSVIYPSYKLFLGARFSSCLQYPINVAYHTLVGYCESGLKVVLNALASIMPSEIAEMHQCLHMA